MFSIERNDRSLKRRRSHSPNRSPSAKKQRQQDHPDHWVPSERFWDTLPKIYLTHRALIEHDRRNRLPDSKLQTPTKIRHLRRRSTRLQQLTGRNHLLSLCSASSNTIPELRRFARHGGPDLSTIRGFPDPTMSDQTSRPSKRTTSSKKSGPYDQNYQMKLAQAGIFLTEEIDENDDVVLPNNYDEITTRLNDERPSLSPSRFTEKDFQKFRRQTEQEILEAETMQKSMTVIEGSGSGIYSRMGGPFNNLEPFDPELAMAVPDSYDGAPPLNIDHRVLNDLGEYIVPNTDSSRPAAPNFYLEGKSRKGRADVAKRQAAHTGAIGARSMMNLQSYPARALTYDGNAYAFTSTYHDGQLKMYTSHATAPETEGGPPQYHMSQVGAFAMTHNSRTFREGATHYRNARDLAKEQRDSFIQGANQVARLAPTSKHGARSRTSTNTPSMRTTSQSELYEDILDTDTSADELALDKVFKRSRSTIAVNENNDEEGEEAEEDNDEGDDIIHTSFTSSAKDHDWNHRNVRTSYRLQGAFRTIKAPSSTEDPSRMMMPTAYRSPISSTEQAFRPEQTSSLRGSQPTPRETSRVRSAKTGKSRSRAKSSPQTLALVEVRSKRVQRR